MYEIPTRNSIETCTILQGNEDKLSAVGTFRSPKKIILCNKVFFTTIINQLLAFVYKDICKYPFLWCCMLYQIFVVIHFLQLFFDTTQIYHNLRIQSKNAMTSSIFKAFDITPQYRSI